SARSGFAYARQHAPASPTLVSTLRLRLRSSARFGFAYARQLLAVGNQPGRAPGPATDGTALSGERTSVQGDASPPKS
ncbi:MAG: hypothetical protein M3338_02320, partial [Actinomycetota bacterium]|nr:hypothetical protein [Actinomycetota bacterium]